VPARRAGASSGSSWGAPPPRGPAARGRGGGAPPGARATGSLARWQLSRASQKESNARLLAERGAQPELAPDALASDAAGGEAQWQRHIALQGRWDAAHTVFLMNRTLEDGRAGFLVTTPLVLKDGTAVIVQRGWVPRDDFDPMKPPAVAAPAGEVAVRGRVAPWPSHWFEVGHAASGPVRQNIEQSSLVAESGLRLRPVTIVEEANAGNAADGLRRDWAPPASGVSVATNYGYAAQWSAMSLGFLGLWVWVQFVRPRQLARRAAQADPDTPSP
jgi:surfeit locus 1 family protein